MGAVLFSLPAALIGAIYYTMAFGLGLFEAFSLYVGLGFMVMAGIMLFNCVLLGLSKAYSDPAPRTR